MKSVDQRGAPIYVTYQRNYGTLFELTDDLGHSLALASADACGLGLADTLIYDGLPAATYQYDGANLTQVVDPDGSPLRQYAYKLGTSLLLAVLNESSTATVEFSYNSDGRAIGIADRNSFASITYDGNGSRAVTEYFGSSYGTSTRMFDSRGRVTSVSADCACGPARTLTYSSGLLTCDTDALGHRTYREYDTNSRMLRQAEYAGLSCSPTSGQLSDERFRQEWRDYGVAKAVAQGVTLPLALPVSNSRKSTLNTSNLVANSFDYDRALQSIDPVGYSCGPASLPSGAVVCRFIRSGYLLASNGATVFERHGTFYSYDGKGRMVKTIGPINLDRPNPTDVTPVEERTYWPDSDSLERRGRLKELRRYPGGTSAPQLTSFDYDRFGVAREAAPNGDVSTVIRDGRGRTRFVSGPGSGRVEIRYYDGFQPRLRVSATGGAVRYGYDSKGRTELVEYLTGDPDLAGSGATVSWSEHSTYDPAGNPIVVERRDGSGTLTWTMHRDYDVGHRVVRQWQIGDGTSATTVAYDASGFLTSVTDPDGRVSTFSPDVINRVAKIRRSGLDQQGHPVGLDVSTYTYQPMADALASVTDGKNLTTYLKYDDFGRLIQVNSYNFKWGAYDFTYDARGNLMQRKGGLVTLTYTYDGLDRVVSATAANSADSSAIAYTYRYDEGGQTGLLTSVVDADRTIRFEYEAGSRLHRERISENGVAAELVTTYWRDFDGDVVSIDYPSGSSVAYVLDPATKRPLRVYDPVSGFDYGSHIAWLPSGPISAVTLSDGTVALRTFDQRYMPASLVSDPLSLVYGTSPAKDITSISEGTGSRTFTYDFLDRIVDSPSWLSYTYDAAGNRTGQTVDSATSTFIYNFDRLKEERVPSGGSTVRTRGFSYDYQTDLSGVGLYSTTSPYNLIAGVCLWHDALGRLGSAFASTYAGSPDYVACTSDNPSAGQLIARFKYDHFNRRIARYSASTGEWTQFLHDRGGHLLSEVRRPTTGSGAWVPVRDYVWIEDTPVAQIERGVSPARSYSFHVDAVRLPRRLTSPDGQVVWAADPRPYGDLVETTVPDSVTSKTVVTNLRLPGQYDERLLGSVGLQGPYYNWHRWYLPSVGRYLELDPPALQGLLDVRGKVLGPTPEWYAYARGSPLRYTDPMGLYGTKCCTFYERRCAQSGGTSTYFCTLANSVCNRVEKGDPWSDCVRKCLQDMDRAKRNDSDKDQVCKPLPYSAGDFTADHALCFAQCKVDTNSNPFNNTSEPNDDNCEH